MPAPTIATAQEGAAAVAVGDDAERQQRVLDAALDRRRTRRAARRRRRVPAIVSGAPQPSRLGVGEAVDEREQAGRGGERAGHVDPRPARPAPSSASRRSAATAAGTARIRLTNIVQRQSRYSVSAPPRIRPTAAPEAAMIAEDAERAVALRGNRERRGQQAQRRRREQRGERALERAGGDEDAEALGEPAERGGGGEAGEADDEDALAAERGRRGARRAAAGCRTRARTR